MQASTEQRLWVEKYRPLIMDNLEFHHQTGQMLTKLADSDDFPHILFYGPSGAGKRTLTKCLLHSLYGSTAVHKIKSEHKEFKAGASGSTVVDCVIFSSIYHIEVTPSEADQHDRVIVQKMIKEVAGSQQLDQKQQKKFKIVVIHEIDNLTKEAQAALRRTMETYMPYCRIVANAESLSKVIQPVRSRCLQVRVPAPKEVEMMKVLKLISQKEGFNLPEKLAAQISYHSRRNLRRAVMMLQTMKLKTEELKETTSVPMPEYENYTKKIADQVKAEQSPKQLRQIRTQLYELLTKGITADMIFGVLMNHFLKIMPDIIRPEILKFAVMFEHRCKSGAKAIMHLEAFLARVMAIYKGFTVKNCY